MIFDGDRKEKQRIHDFLESAMYSIVGLKANPRPAQYHENPTPTQRAIELTITNGRGYQSLGEALEIVNRSSPQVTLYEVIKAGVVPINFKLPEFPQSSNPCGETLLSDPVECIFPAPRRPPTLIESVDCVKYIKHVKSCEREHLLAG